MSTINYRDMTAEQKLAWGEQERRARIDDLKDKTPAGLKRAQANARARRLAIGASDSAAASMVADAGRAARRKGGAA